MSQTKTDDLEAIDTRSTAVLGTKEGNPDSNETAVPDQWAVLAGLRFALAFIVVAHHLTSRVSRADLFHQPGLFGGFAAVMGFFIISGYSMAHSLTRDPDAWKFYERRFWRIYPLYLWALILAAIPSILFTTAFRNVKPGYFICPTRHEFLQAAVFLQGFTMRELPANGVVWSLSIEVWLYALSPLLLKSSRRVVSIVIGASAALYLLHDHLVHTLGEFRHDIYGIAFLSLGWIYLVGFYLYRYRSSLPNPLAIAIALVGMMCWYNGDRLERLSPLTAAAAFAIVFYAPQFRLTPRARRIALWLGDLSLPLYLIHVPVMDVFQGLAISNGAIIISSVFAVAIFSLYVIDTPIRTWRRRSSRNPSQVV
jgi:peptidoglycan/LPS O-acetylase OafA/YrhL